LAARYAEYVGWMCQEAGNNDMALWWTDRAVELAATGDDRDMASYALVRRALMALYRHDAAATVELSRSAQLGSVLPRIRGLAAQREAQGHALAGDRDACLRCLDSARALFASASSDPGAPVLGPTNLTDPVAMITGWCLYDLGRPGQAAEVLDREITRVPVHALRAHTRYGLRRALAHAATTRQLPQTSSTRSCLAGSAPIRSSAPVSRFRGARTISAACSKLSGAARFCSRSSDPAGLPRSTSRAADAWTMRLIGPAGRLSRRSSTECGLCPF
jgi:hypothetical protein